MISKIIKIPIYCATLTINLDKDLLDTQSKYKTTSLHDYGAITLRHPEKERHYIVSFRERNDYSLIAHEIVHIINYIFIDCGIELDRVNDENQAYFTGWLFKEIDRFLNPKK